MKNILKIAFIFSLTANVFALDFKLGEDMTSVTLNGAAGIICDSGTNYAVKAFVCNKDQLLPANEDFLVDESLDANKIIITYRNRKGELKEKKFSFNKKLGQSKRRINLWKKNLWKDPILQNGSNELIIKAYKGRKLVLEEVKTISVYDGGLRNCDSIVVKSRDMADCYSMNNACDLYFKAQNYCE